MISVGGSVICERTVLAAGQLADLTHVTRDDVGNAGVDIIPGLNGLEVDVSVLGGTAGDGSVGIEGPLAESLQ